MTHEASSSWHLNEEDEQLSSGYRWPGNRLSHLDARRLTYVSNKTGRPINQIIKEAVAHYTTMMIERLEAEGDDERS